MDDPNEALLSPRSANINGGQSAGDSREDVFPLACCRRDDDALAGADTGTASLVLGDRHAPKEEIAPPPLASLVFFFPFFFFTFFAGN